MAFNNYERKEIESDGVVYTDGGSNINRAGGNERVGSWAFYVLGNESMGISEHRDSGVMIDPEATNQKMEVIALQKAMEYIKSINAYDNLKFKFVTDSQYAFNCIINSSWGLRWREYGWKRKTENGFEEVKNLKEIQSLFSLMYQDVPLNLSTEKVAENCEHGYPNRKDYKIERPKASYFIQHELAHGKSKNEQHKVGNDIVDKMCTARLNEAFSNLNVLNKNEDPLGVNKNINDKNEQFDGVDY